MLPNIFIVANPFRMLFCSYCLPKSDKVTIRIDCKEEHYYAYTIMIE